MDCFIGAKYTHQFFADPGDENVPRCKNCGARVLSVRHNYCSTSMPYSRTKIERLDTEASDIIDHCCIISKKLNLLWCYIITHDQAIGYIRAIGHGLFLFFLGIFWFIFLHISAHVGASLEGTSLYLYLPAIFYCHCCVCWRHIPW